MDSLDFLSGFPFFVAALLLLLLPAPGSGLYYHAAARPCQQLIVSGNPIPHYLPSPLQEQGWEALFSYKQTGLLSTVSQCMYLNQCNFQFAYSQKEWNQYAK